MIISIPNTFFCLISFSFVLCAQDTSPTNAETLKIDARLKELALIWQQDTAIINRLTNNKRTPVREGTREYFMCLESSKRINQAEAEAKILKEKKANLGNGNIKNPNVEVGKMPDEDPFAETNPVAIAREKQRAEAEKKEKVDEQAKVEASKNIALDGVVNVIWEGRPNILFGGTLRVSTTSPLDSLPEGNVTYTLEKHGLKIKKLFVGMPYSQAKEILKELALGIKKSPTKEKLIVEKGQDKFIARECRKIDDSSAFEVKYSLIDKSSLNQDEGHNQINIITLQIDSDGIISEINFDASCFKVGESSLAQFVEAFSANYDVELESSTKSSRNYGIDSVSVTYENLSVSGNKVEISHLLATEYSTDIEWGKTTLDSTLNVRLSKSVSAADLKKEFE